MRELTTLTNQPHADRLAAWLVTQSVPTNVDEEDGHWVIWIVNDDDRARAQQLLEEFQQNPNDPRYDSALIGARKLAQQETANQKRTQQRQINVGQRWRGPWWKSSPITTMLIAVSVLVAIVGTDWQNAQGGRFGLPALCNNLQSPVIQALRILDLKVLGDRLFATDTLWDSVQKGQIWRPITPIFLHFGVLHILFNMMWTRQLGTQIEFAIGSLRYTAIIILIAFVSNVAQLIWSGPMFGGMSGVVFGLIGYAWIKGKTRPQDGLGVPQETMVYAMLFLLLCMGGALGDIANAAHLVGLVVGLACGSAEYLWNKLQFG